MQKLLDGGIASRRGIMTTHRETAYRNIQKDVNLPVSEDLQDRSIILPLYVPMANEEINYIIRIFNELIQPVEIGLKSHF